MKKIEDLIIQKRIAQNEANHFMKLLNNSKDLLEPVITIPENNNQSRSEFIKKNKRIAHILKWRKISIVILAANRLSKLKKEAKYGIPLGKSSYSFTVNNIPSISMMKDEYISEDLIKGAISKLTNNFLTQGSNTKLLIQSLEELGKFGKRENSLAKTTLSESLKQGIIEIKKQYSWEYNIKETKYVDKIFQKMIQEYIIIIRKKLNSIPIFEEDINTLRRRGEDYMKELSEMKVKRDEYEKQIKNLTAELNESNRNNNIIIKECEGIKQSLIDKDKAIESYTANVVMLSII